MKNRNETFVTIEGFENYSISNKGKVMSYMHSEEGRLLKPQRDAMGYYHVRLYDGTDIRGTYKNGDAKPKLEKIHRLVAMHFLPEPDKDVYMEVNHISGDKQDNDVTNLEWLTRMENIQHAWRIGLNEEGRRIGGNKRKKPVKVIHKDGREEFYEGRVQASFYLGVTPMTILKKIESQSFGMTGFKVQDATNMSIDEFVERIDAVEKKIEEFNKHYYSKVSKLKRKKLAEQK